MLVRIQDRAALSSLSIVSLKAYLVSRDWKNVGPWGQRPATVYAKEHAGRTWEVLLPTRDTVADYAESMAECVSALAAVEDRSQLDVFYDLSAAGADVIQLRSLNGQEGSSLSLRQSADMLDHAYKMLEAGARSAEQPKAIYRGKLTSEAAEYLDGVLPVPGYSRGYGLTLHSPVPAGFGQQQDFGDDFVPPFSRRVTSQLANGLRHSLEAIARVVGEDTLEPFREAVTAGVSANLCDSVATLAKRAEGIEIGVSWAGVRPSNSQDASFRFTANSADILQEAARSFRATEPSYDERIVGLVVRLDREPHEFDGRATIASVLDGRLIRINVKFERQVYDTVIRAFQEQTDISLDGDVHRSVGRYELRNPRNLRVTPEV